MPDHEERVGLLFAELSGPRISSAAYVMPHRGFVENFVDKRVLATTLAPYGCRKAPCGGDARHELDDASGDAGRRRSDVLRLRSQSAARSEPGPLGRVAGALRLPGPLPLPTLPRTPRAGGRLNATKSGVGRRIVLESTRATSSGCAGSGGGAQAGLL